MAFVGTLLWCPLDARSLLHACVNCFTAKPHQQASLSNPAVDRLAEGNLMNAQLNVAKVSEHAATTLNEMIEVLHDGETFYAEAAMRVKQSNLRDLFRRMSEHKSVIAHELSNVVVALGNQPASDGSLAGSLRKFYAEIRAKLSTDPDYHYVAQLEEFEDRIVESFERAVADSRDSIARQIADRYFSSVRKDHNIMRDLKQEK
jgi:uncharacterized protein (TIGR02284 family)